MPPESPIIGAILLAAGTSRRMGDQHKLLADWNGRPLVAHAAAAITAAGLPPPLVVLGARAIAVRAALGDQPAHYVVAVDHAEGMSRSLRAGLAAVPADWAGVLVCLADMPRVQPRTIAALARALANAGDAAIAVPVMNGRRGNPVGWGRAHFPALTAIDGDGGGRLLLRQAGDRVVSVAALDSGIHDDIDTPESLALLRLRPETARETD